MPELKDSLHLEPRVARLETGLETLTRNVSEIAISMRENALATNAKIDNLVVAVTQAQAPKKTDWSLFVSIGFFILALGSAVFWPLNREVQDNKDSIDKVNASFVEHSKLTLHPVGASKVEALEKIVSTQDLVMESKIASLDTKLQKETSLALTANENRLTDLDLRIQKEFNLKNETFQIQLNAIKSAQDLVNERMYARVLKLEAINAEEYSKNVDELRQWRLKAMNGEIKSAFPISISPSSSDKK